VKELSAIWVSNANPAWGVAPTDVKIAVDVFSQVLGVIIQAGILSVVVSKMKYEMAF
jgi:hypothetical protein